MGHIGKTKQALLRVLGGVAFAFVLFIGLTTPTPALALTPNEAILARELWHHGMGYVQIAAILGNAAGESGCDPTVDYDLSGQFNWPYEWGCGLFGYTDCGYSPTQLVLMQRTQLKTWAVERGWDWASIEAQVEFTFGDSGGISWREDWLPNLAENGYYWGYSGVPENMEYDATPDDFLTETRLDVATYSWMACYGRGAAEPNHFADGLNEENTGRMGEAQRVYDEISTGAYDLFFAETGDGIPAARPEEVQEVEQAQETPVEYIPITEPETVSINDPEMPVVRYVPRSDPTYAMPTTPANARPPERKKEPKKVQINNGPLILGALVVFGICIATFVVGRKQLEKGDEEVDWLEWSLAGALVEELVEKQREKAGEKADPEVMVVPAPEETEAQPESEPEPEAESETEPEPDSESEPEAQSEPEAELEDELESAEEPDQDEDEPVRGLDLA